MATPERHFIPDFVRNGELKYNVMLSEIAKKLDGEDLKTLKFILLGPCGISKREMEKVTTAEDLFTCLKQRMMLTKDNLLFLQALLRYIDRKDLQGMVGDYAKDIGNTLYFYEPPGQPENGFTHVRFHVDVNLRSFEGPTLEKLREEVAVLLNVPKEFIFLVGVEEGSVILTFMISEQYADQLKDMFEKHKDSFRQFGVDGIFVVDPPTVDETYLERAPFGDIQSQLSAIYDRQNQMTSQLGDLKETTDDRLSQMASQFSQLAIGKDDRLSQMASQLNELKEAIDDRQNQMTSQLGELKETSELRRRRQGLSLSGPILEDLRGLRDELSLAGPISKDLRGLRDELSFAKPIYKEIRELCDDLRYPSRLLNELRRLRDELRLTVPISEELHALRLELSDPFPISAELRRLRDELRLTVPIFEGRTKWQQKMAKASTEFQEDKFSQEIESERNEITRIQSDYCSPPFLSLSARLISGVKTPQTNPYGKTEWEQKDTKASTEFQEDKFSRKPEKLRDVMSPSGTSSEGKLQSLCDDLDSLDISSEEEIL